MVLGAGLAYKCLWPHYHLETVADDVLYRSGTLAASSLEQVIQRYGIRTVVNLRSQEENSRPWYAEEEGVCRTLGVELLNIPMPADTPPTKRQISAWLDLFRNEGRTPVLVHCQHGVIRTGMMVAVYQREYENRSNQEILADLPWFGHSIDTPERKPVREFILCYEPQRGGGTHPETLRSKK